VRLINGLLACGIAVATPLLAREMSRGVWIVSITLLGLGAFSIFEGLRGWCVLRAFGVRTRF
jgi:hypothetical protein